MCQATCSRSIRTDAVEIQIVLRRLSILVQRRSPARARIEVREGGRVPCHAKAVNIEEAVAGADLLFRGDVV